MLLILNYASARRDGGEVCSVHLKNEKLVSAFAKTSKYLCVTCWKSGENLIPGLGDVQIQVGI